MEFIQFKANVRKHGNSAVITIPSEYIGDEIIIGNSYYVNMNIDSGDSND